MLAVYTLVVGLIVSGLLIFFTWLGRRMILRKGPTAGFIVAGLMGLLAISQISRLVEYCIELLQATGLKNGIYHLFFMLAVAIPLVTASFCALLLLVAAIVARRKRQRRLHQRG